MSAPCAAGRAASGARRGAWPCVGRQPRCPPSAARAERARQPEDLGGSLSLADRQGTPGGRMPPRSLPSTVQGSRVAMMKIGALLDIWGASPSAPATNRPARPPTDPYGPAHRLGPGAPTPTNPRASPPVTGPGGAPTPEGRQPSGRTASPRASTGRLDRNVRVSPAGPETRVSRVKGHERRHPPERRMAGRSPGPAAGRAPGRPPTSEAAPPTPANPHVTATVPSSLTAADS